MIAPAFIDEEFYTAADKRKILKTWQRFIRSGFTEEKFTQRLYSFIHMHCGFIAHYSRSGFYATYFETVPAFLEFWGRFTGVDTFMGVPLRVYSGWGAATGHDLVLAMLDYAEQVNGIVRWALDYKACFTQDGAMTAMSLLHHLSSPEWMALPAPFSADLQRQIAAAFGTQSHRRAKGKASHRLATPQAQLSLF